ncbi:MAG TPA: oxygenase MpaB family protein [Amycolatopsis sp.]|uniref:oxygenase MpaB family protein n=1 Tax=Amycolatopsis sp. TaxID=37632 RepID=UPI002B4A9887|nr:oxygenase MpaB family protein [Amycolatopsis sp.]HKS49056.1 oxygenase MpaB family protein [Amycolatopsis sp.]
MAPQPLGPDSLTWKYFGDWRGLSLALWAGSMQNMHPRLGLAVEQHSRFFAERWQRLFRSLYPIGGVVYDGARAAETARAVRGYHDTIQGVDAEGRGYHALEPETFYWAHSTFFMLTVLIGDRMCGGLTEHEKRRLFDEHVRWYRLYGMSMRVVPRSWDEFQDYWDRMCAEVLEDNKATRDVLDLRELAKPTGMPAFVWPVLRPVVARTFLWWTVGLYHPAVRRLLGFRWSARDERLHRFLGRTINAIFRLVPHDRRYHPRARAAWRRARGEIAEDTPLVETPARNLPPPGERDRPTHYSPKPPFKGGTVPPHEPRPIRFRRLT